MSEGEEGGGEAYGRVEANRNKILLLYSISLKDIFPYRHREQPVNSCGSLGWPQYRCVVLITMENGCCFSVSPFKTLIIYVSMMF